MKIISLFCGAGGLDLGLIQAGNTVVWANDLDPDAVATYKKGSRLGQRVFSAHFEYQRVEVLVPVVEPELALLQV